MEDYKSARGWLTDAEREWLKELAADVDASRGDAYRGWIVNIGVEYGASLVCLRTGAPHAKLVGIDIIGDSKLESPVKELIVIKGDSTVVGSVWDCADLVFVDGGHDFETVLKDAEEWGRTLVAGGRIAFHDTKNSPAEEAVNRAVDAWFAIHAGEFNELKRVDSIRTFERRYEF